MKFRILKFRIPIKSPHEKLDLGFYLSYFGQAFSTFLVPYFLEFCSYGSLRVFIRVATLLPF
jgi:hypothetical protein